VTIARSKMVEAGEPGFYHCTSRCVRRAFLLGEDPYTGKNYDHRKKWVVDRLRHLSQAFAVEITGYAIMINHTLCGAPHKVCYVKRVIMWRWAALSFEISDFVHFSGTLGQKYCT